MWRLCCVLRRHWILFTVNHKRATLIGTLWDARVDKPCDQWDCLPARGGLRGKSRADVLGGSDGFVYSGGERDSVLSSQFEKSRAASWRDFPDMTRVDLCFYVEGIKCSYYCCYCRTFVWCVYRTNPHQIILIKNVCFFCWIFQNFYFLSIHTSVHDNPIIIEQRK